MNRQRDRVGPVTANEQRAEFVYRRLSPLMAAFGALFFVLIIGQRFAHGSVGRVLGLAVVLLWALFVVEYLLRLIIARCTGRFLASTWWQIALLAVPLLSIFRALSLLRLSRPARVVAASVRGSRSARHTLSGRVMWLAMTSAIVVFAAADLLYELGDVRPYGAALHDAAVGGISGESIANGGDGWAAVIDVVLSVYSAVVFAALAGALGAYFLERREEVRNVRDETPVVRAPGEAAVDLSDRGAESRQPRSGSARQHADTRA